MMRQIPTGPAFSIVLLLGLIAVCPRAEAQLPSFQLVLGVADAEVRNRESSDSGERLIEAHNGDLIVGGYGAADGSDVVTDIVRRPLLARVHRSGQLLWQRIYYDLGEYSVEALLSDSSGDYVVLIRDNLDSVERYGSPYRDIVLRRIETNGDLLDPLTELRLAFPHDGIPVFENGMAGVLIHVSSGPGLFDDSFVNASRPLTILWSDGSVERRPFPFEEGAIVAAGSGEVLVRQTSTLLRDDPGNVTVIESSGQTFLSLAADGSSHTRFTLDGPERTGNPIAATADSLILSRLSPDRETVAVSLLFYEFDGALRASVVTPSATLERLSGVLPVATADGGLLAVGVDTDAPWVGEYARSGELLWSGRFRPANGMAHVKAAIILADGALAVTGSTSPLRERRAQFGDGADAFLLIAERSAAGLAAASE